MNKRVIFEIDISGWPLSSREFMEHKKYSIARSLGTKALGTIGLSNNSMARYSYSWDDPFTIRIEARIAKPRERVSGRFMGYEWMIDNLVKYGTPYGGKN
jgi:hypothetical protein